MSSSSDDSDKIKEGDYIIVKTESVLRLVQLKNNKPQYFGKCKARFMAAVGHLYSSFFEVKPDGKLVKLEKPEQIEDLLLKFDGDREIKDNRDLIDTGESQKLTTSDIEAFKKQGLSGQEMVQKIVENSASFQDKTLFAKEKYLRKKQKKYMNFVQILKPNVRLLTEMYYMQGPSKIQNLRIDSLSQMLAFCNVMSGCKIMVMDSVVGLLTAAVLERLSLCGCVVQIHCGPFSINPFQQVIKALNIPSDQLQSILYNIDLRSVKNVSAFEKTDDSMMVDSSEGDTPAVVKTEDSVMGDISEGDNKNHETVVKERNSKVEKRDHVQKAKDILASKSMDSLLIAVKHHPENALFLLDYLCPSRPFAIFSMFQSPLVDCYVKLKARGDIISLNICETWLRKYQVLPNRTHPCYNMSGSGGFLLMGIKVEPRPGL